MRTKRTRVVVAPPPLLPKPNSCHRTTLETKRALTPCLGGHPGFKFIRQIVAMAEAQCAQNRHGKIKNSIKIIVGSPGEVGGWGLGAGALHPVPCSKTSGVVVTAPICRRFDCIRCSMRAVVMPHSATSIASGDEISTTVSWNSGV
jgi:hypothetical protein